MPRIGPLAEAGEDSLKPVAVKRRKASATAAADAGRRARSFSRQDAIRQSKSTLAPAGGFAATERAC